MIIAGIMELSKLIIFNPNPHFSQGFYCGGAAGHV
jgi:hypothetical protein